MSIPLNESPFDCDGCIVACFFDTPLAEQQATQEFAGHSRLMVGSPTLRGK